LPLYILWADTPVNQLHSRFLTLICERCQMWNSYMAYSLPWKVIISLQNHIYFTQCTVFHIVYV